MESPRRPRYPSTPPSQARRQRRPAMPTWARHGPGPTQRNPNGQMESPAPTRPPPRAPKDDLAASPAQRRLNAKVPPLRGRLFQDSAVRARWPASIDRWPNRLPPCLAHSRTAAVSLFCHQNRTPLLKANHLSNPHSAKMRLLRHSVLARTASPPSRLSPPTFSQPPPPIRHLGFCEGKGEPQGRPRRA